ncbi:DUF4145 domain-containing protein [Enterobacter hormaechei]|uniref:DUF4145 domain-containing protein n=2 Tax=Enterobacter hormaechei TaxID=158836 RepID=UPI001880B68D|nr:DUF4145 domain-containing protein [Enterobacter hormaechei]MBE8821225.1 DUF4145 domain-containing protein [Enterobacter hormaechei]MBE8836934.1 DUF4145 domain-containing protein [Enterobacter hormaechei]MBE8964140.1 DUF4145 domain-containing protein [Enterobacter hormaechei]
MGMLSFDIFCPHCKKENAVLEAFGEHHRHATYFYDVAFFCRSCAQAGIAVVMSPRMDLGPYKQSKQYSEVDLVIPRSENPYELMAVYPEPSVHVAPESTPKRAADSFIESKDNLQRGKYDTSVMLCRKTIDIATRTLLGEDSKDEKLVQRISMLHAKGLITEQMKNWAHIVRFDSNGAVHSDEEFSKEEAAELIGFTEVFLIYAFQLPAMVSSRKQEH